MQSLNKRFKHIDVLRQEFAEKKNAIRQRLEEFRQVPQRRYFYELLYCLMTPQSSAVHAAYAQIQFQQHQYRTNDLDIEKILSNKQHYIRFHKTKATWIAAMKQQYDEIERVVTSTRPAVEKRLWLADHVLGLSFKEATHFLRNIGMNDGLTILDRHIIKNLKFHGVIRTAPKTMTRRTYISIEKAFVQFSAVVGISTDELDLLFWSRETGKILK